MSIVLQPARLADRVIAEHYENTIVNPVRFSEYDGFFDDPIVERLVRLFPGGTAPIWGIIPSAQTRAPFGQMAPGDSVFFTGGNRVYLGGTVALKWENPRLAERLWGTDKRGHAWAWMYAIAGARGLDIPIAEVRTALAWGADRHVRSLTVLSPLQDELRKVLDADSVPELEGAIDAVADAAAVDAYSGALERTAFQARRGEQAALKRRLLSGPVGACAMCGRLLPSVLLVAAHIKKRAACSDEEKRDLANIAMLACILGCDALYEYGFITVDPGGMLRISPLVEQEAALADHVRGRLEGRVVEWWNEEREPYFEWHRRHTFKASLAR